MRDLRREKGTGISLVHAMSSKADRYDPTLASTANSPSESAAQDGFGQTGSVSPTETILIPCQRL